MEPHCSEYKAYIGIEECVTGVGKCCYQNMTANHQKATKSLPPHSSRSSLHCKDKGTSVDWAATTSSWPKSGWAVLPIYLAWFHTPAFFLAHGPLWEPPSLGSEAGELLTGCDFTRWQHLVWKRGGKAPAVGQAPRKRQYSHACSGGDITNRRV